MTWAVIIGGIFIWTLYEKYKKGGIERRPGDSRWNPERREEPKEKYYSSFIGYVISFLVAAPCALLLLLGCIQGIFANGEAVAQASSRNLRWGLILIIPVIITQLIFRRRS